MNVFTWDGGVDTLLSPMDSILHYKYLLQTGLMSMDPQTGYIKAWAGGVNHHYFNTIMSKKQKASRLNF